MKNLFLLAFLTLLNFQCSDNTSQNIHNNILAHRNLSLQVFTIDMKRDTIIYGTHGTVFHIRKESFICENGNSLSEKITIQLKEAIQLEDIALAGLQTITKDNEILASNGMLHLSAEDENGCRLILKQGKMIKTVLPNAGMKEGLKLFQGIETEEGLTWLEKAELSNIKVMEELAIGKSLYEKHCMNCHSDNLREDATGPALGNVHLYRKRDWFRRFTRNSQRMIAEGDSIALCLWQDWKPMVMNTFHAPTIIGDPDDPNSPTVRRTPPEGEALSDQDIDFIYDYLANESILQKIGSTEIEYVVECDFDGVYSSNNPILFPDDALASKIGNIFNINKLGWANIDYFLNDPRAKEQEFYVETNRNIPNTRVSIVFPNFNIFIETSWQEDGQYSFAHAYGKETVSFPIGEPAIVIATATKGESVFFGYKKITYGDEETIKVKTQKSTAAEIEKTIREIL